MSYTVFLRETGTKRHLRLGNNCLTSKWMHGIMFDSEDKAIDAARWALENNPDTLDSGYVADHDGRKVWTSKAITSST